MSIVSPIYCSGVFIEPLIHPKPGGVTRVINHHDKSIYNFILNNLVFCNSIFHIYKEESTNCAIGRTFQTIIFLLRKYRLKTNTSMGSWILHIPIALSAKILGGKEELNIEAIIDSSMELIRSASSCDTKGYFELLRYYSPSHLGKLKKGGIDVRKEGNTCLPSLYTIVRRVGQEDIVHNELAKGYPVSLEAFKSIDRLVKNGFNFEESVFQTILSLLSKYPDTLITRKYGITVALKVLKSAKLVLENKLDYQKMESFMRSNNLNPGSILDIVSMGITFYFIKNLGSLFDERNLTG